MYRAPALYPMPEDPRAFREHYETVHIPLVLKLAGVRAMRYGFDLTSAQGESPYFAVFEVEWDDSETMAASLSSPEGQAVAADMAPYVTGRRCRITATPSPDRAFARTLVWSYEVEPDGEGTLLTSPTGHATRRPDRLARHRAALRRARPELRPPRHRESLDALKASAEAQHRDRVGR
jgi:uncharacterized protein (TIGR02118 family)